jgi:hypothetical protein
MPVILNCTQFKLCGFQIGNNFNKTYFVKEGFWLGRVFGLRCKLDFYLTWIKDSKSWNFKVKNARF